MKKLNNKGLAPVLIVVITLVVVAVGFAGYRVYQNSKDKPGDNKTTQADTAKQEATPQATAQTEQKDKNEGYLVIKEWGVRIKTTDSSENFYYKANENVHTMDIYSKAADTLVGSGGKTCKGEYIEFISRYAADDASQNDPQTTGPFTKIKSIDGYTYWSTTHKDYAPECLFAGDGTTVDQTVSDKFDVIVRTFSSDTSTIQAAQ